jgi:hypothetical protein
MLVRDSPPTVDLAEAESRAHPYVGLFAVGLGSADPVESMAAGDVGTGYDVKVSDLETDRPFLRCGTILPGWS